jgi:hypothetical protein
MLTNDNYSFKCQALWILILGVRILITDETVCDYDEGFIAGILKVYTSVALSLKY